jgi:NitT/TauT family transport system permease protein
MRSLTMGAAAPLNAHVQNEEGEAGPMSTANTTFEKVGFGKGSRPPGLLRRAGSASWTWRIVSLVAFFLAWEIAGRSNFNFAFPSFTATIGAFFSMVADGTMGAAYLRTIEPLIIGLVISLTIGISSGVAMGLRKDFEWFTLPMFIVMQAAPMSALIPLITFVYGIGLTSKVLAVVMLAMPVIAINSYKAVRNVPPSLVSMCHSFMGSRRQQIFRIILPAASPMMFAGLRLGIAEGFSGVVLAELLITPTGIGDLITFHRSVANYDHMYAAIASIILFAVLAVTALQYVETAIFRPETRSAS